MQVTCSPHATLSTPAPQLSPRQMPWPKRGANKPGPRTPFSFAPARLRRTSRLLRAPFKAERRPNIQPHPTDGPSRLHQPPRRIGHIHRFSRRIISHNTCALRLGSFPASVALLAVSFSVVRLEQGPVSDLPASQIYRPVWASFARKPSREVVKEVSSTSATFASPISHQL